HAELITTSFQAKSFELVGAVKLKVPPGPPLLQPSEHETDHRPMTRKPPLSTCTVRAARPLSAREIDAVGGAVELVSPLIAIWGALTSAPTPPPRDASTGQATGKRFFD